MNFVEEKWLRGLLRRGVKQGYDHHYRIQQFYRLIYQACRSEFTEDSQEELKAFLTECHQKGFED